MNADLIPREIDCRSALNKTGIPGYEYCMNPYVGCAHGCVYCYASFMCRFTGHREKWGEFLDVKANFPDILAKQLGGRRIRPSGRVLLGTVTDAYQPAEARYEITRASLKILAGHELLEVHVLTKSALVQRDIAILRTLRACEVGFTITTLDDRVARVLEPGASSPHLRLDAAVALRKGGIPVWIFIAPLLPGVTDAEEALTQLFQSLRAAKIREILVDFLNPYPAVVHRLRTVYQQHFPGALPELTEYLNHPANYRDRIEGRLHRVSALAGCSPSFV